jgi:hypothetical protein
MKDWGMVLVTGGALMTVLVGFAFYAYFQQLLAASTSSASGSSASLANALAIYNGTVNMPILVTVAIFGFALLILGGVYFAVGNAAEIMLDQRENASSTSSQIATVRPSRACMKCGSLIYQNTAYCPNCGSSLATPQAIAQSNIPQQRG